MENNIGLIFISMPVSAVLYLTLATYKQYSKLWWFIGGALIILPIAMFIPALQNFLLSPLDIPNTVIFITIYFLIYLSLWFFAKRNIFTDAERVKKLKIDHAIFEGFLSMREKNLEDAYYHFKQGHSVDPNNKVINTMLESLDSGRLGKFNHNPILEKWYHFKSLFRKKS